MRLSRLCLACAIFALTPAPSHADDERTSFINAELAGGVARATGAFGEDYGTTGVGSLATGVSNRQFGVRMSVTNAEFAANSAANQRYSALLGRPVEIVFQTIPIEIQGFAAFPDQVSPLSFLARAGLGPHFTVLYVKDGHQEIEERARFGYSLAAGGRFAWAQFGTQRDALLGLDLVYRDTDGLRYLSLEMTLAMLFG